MRLKERPNLTRFKIVKSSLEEICAVDYRKQPVGGIKIIDLKIDEIFNKNTKEIFKQFINMDLDEKTYKSSDIKFNDGVSIIVSLSGILSGQVIVNIPRELAKIIYHRHKKGVLAVEIDGNVRKSILELWKIIIGNSCASFYENGVSIELGSYCMIEGNDVNYTTIDKNVTIIQYETALTEANMITILDIYGEQKFSNFNN